MTHQPSTPGPAGDSYFEKMVRDVRESPASQLSVEDDLQHAVLLADGQKLRVKQGLTEREIADRMGMVELDIRDLESGHTQPPVRTLQRYARALDRRFVFEFVDPRLPISTELASQALFAQLREAALSHLLTTLAKKTDKEARTLSALGKAVLLPESMLEPILSLLEAEGWAKAEGKGESSFYSLVEDAAHIIGISLHQDRIVGVLMDMKGHMIQNAFAEVTDRWHETVISVAASVIGDLFRVSDRPVLGVGVSIAGVVDPSSGRVDFAPDLQCKKYPSSAKSANERDCDPWSAVELRKELEQEIQARLNTPGLRVTVENDANALASWEYLRGSDESVVVVLLSGGGIGVGFVIEGKLVHGAHSAAGEGGHTIVDTEGPPCRAGLGHSGCLETMASPQGILTSLHIPASTSKERAVGLADANRLVRDGNPQANSVFETAGKNLGEFVSTRVLLVDPPRAVIYAHAYLVGSVHDCAKVFQHAAQKAIADAASSRLRVIPAPLLEWQGLGNEAGALAAGATALWSFLREPTRWAPSLLVLGERGTSV